MGLSFWKGKRVFLTGHTGFKGAWLSQVLVEAGAQLTGFALAPTGDVNLFDLSGLSERMVSIVGDIRCYDHLKSAFAHSRPEIVIHMAAQPLVMEGYQNPVYTYETNVMGTVNILECLRDGETVKSFLNITTDKVYLNKEWEWGYRETDPLDGFDPYSNSKSCSELVTHSYKDSFLASRNVAVSTARAGNVIGGGDFAENRIIPDCVRAAIGKRRILVRNPNAIRPYQHVLEALFAYLNILEKQYYDPQASGYFNVGPNEADCINTGMLAQLFCQAWGEDLVWESVVIDGPHEANFLKLDCSRIKSVLGWKPRWNAYRAIQDTVTWTKRWLAADDVAVAMNDSIKAYTESY